MDVIFSQIISLFSTIGIIPTLLTILLLLGMVLVFKWGLKKIEYGKTETYKDAEIKRLNDLLIDREADHDDSISKLHKDFFEAKEQQKREYEKTIFALDEKLKQQENFVKEYPIYNLQSLYDHPLFSHIDYWINVKIPNITIEHEVKNKIYIDYCTTMLIIRRERLFEFFRTVNITALTKVELRAKVINLITKMAQEVKNEINSFEIPVVVVRGLHEMVNVGELITFALWDHICESPIVRDNFSKLIALFNVKMVIIEVLLYEISNKLQGLNGRLDGVEYVLKTKIT